LQIAMMGLDLAWRWGDHCRFYFCSYSWSNCIVATNPVLVDVDLYNMNISIDGIRKAITQNKSDCTGSLVWTCSQYGSIIFTAKEHNL
jgi:hypothetical protein